MPASTSDMAPTVTEGEVSFKHPHADEEGKTWYKIFGDLKNSKRTPLIALHGGPGLPHNYMLAMKDLAAEPYNIPIVFYDQIGCGKSTHFPKKDGDITFWTEELFVAEFYNLVKHLGIEQYDIIGHSWGGMLGERIATQRPKGLRKLILTDSVADMKIWIKNARELLKQLPQDIQVSDCRHMLLPVFSGNLID